MTWQRYGIEALGAMAQGAFCSLLIGTIIKTLGTQLGVQVHHGHRYLRHGGLRPCNGGRDRLRAEVAPDGAVLARGGRLGGKRRGRRGRPARGADNRHRRG